MKNICTLLLLTLCSFSLSAQEMTDTEAVERACLDYLEGFYEGDTTKIKRSLKPSLYKFGYWKNKETGKYGGAGHMTFDEAVAYAKGVFDSKKFPLDSAPKKVEILDIENHIAAAKITAWWGIDYLLLSREEDRWVIEQALWEGPLPRGDR